jgi:beta-N-acetylhexosaminidase
VARACRRLRRCAAGDDILREASRQGGRLLGGRLLKAAIVGIAGQALSAAEAALFRSAPPCGVILFARNIAEPVGLAALTAELRRVLPRGAVLMVDQEGGRVARLRPPHWRAQTA